MGCTSSADEQPVVASSNNSKQQQNQTSNSSNKNNNNNNSTAQVIRDQPAVVVNQSRESNNNNNPTGNSNNNTASTINNNSNAARNATGTTTTPGGPPPAQRKQGGNTSENSNNNNNNHRQSSDNINNNNNNNNPLQNQQQQNAQPTTAAPSLIIPSEMLRNVFLLSQVVDKQGNGTINPIGSSANNQQHHHHQPPPTSSSTDNPAITPTLQQQQSTSAPLPAPLVVTERNSNSNNNNNNNNNNACLASFKLQAMHDTSVFVKPGVLPFELKKPNGENEKGPMIETSLLLDVDNHLTVDDSTKGFAALTNVFQLVPVDTNNNNNNNNNNNTSQLVNFNAANGQPQGALAVNLLQNNPTGTLDRSVHISNALIDKEENEHHHQEQHHQLNNNNNRILFEITASSTTNLPQSPGNALTGTHGYHGTPISVIPDQLVTFQQFTKMFDEQSTNNNTHNNNNQNKSKREIEKERAAQLKKDKERYQEELAKHMMLVRTTTGATTVCNTMNGLVLPPMRSTGVANGRYAFRHQVNLVNGTTSITKATTSDDTLAISVTLKDLVQNLMATVSLKPGINGSNTTSNDEDNNNNNEDSGGGNNTTNNSNNQNNRKRNNNSTNNKDDSLSRPGYLSPDDISELAELRNMLEQFIPAAGHCKTATTKSSADRYRFDAGDHHNNNNSKSNPTISMTKPSSPAGSPTTTTTTTATTPHAGMTKNNNNNSNPHQYHQNQYNNNNFSVSSQEAIDFERNRMLRKLCRTTWLDIAHTSRFQSAFLSEWIIHSHEIGDIFFPGEDAKAQVKRMTHFVDMAFRHIDATPTEFHEFAFRLGHKHYAFGVLRSHLELVTRMIMKSLGSSMGLLMTELTEEAFKLSFKVLIDGMLEGAAVLKRATETAANFSRRNFTVRIAQWLDLIERLSMRHAAATGLISEYYSYVPDPANAAGGGGIVNQNNINWVPPSSMKVPAGFYQQNNPLNNAQHAEQDKRAKEILLLQQQRALQDHVGGVVSNVLANLGVPGVAVNDTKVTAPMKGNNNNNVEYSSIMKGSSEKKSTASNNNNNNNNNNHNNHSNGAGSNKGGNAATTITSSSKTLNNTGELGSSSAKPQNNTTSHSNIHGTTDMPNLDEVDDINIRNNANPLVNSKAKLPHEQHTTVETVSLANRSTKSGINQSSSNNAANANNINKNIINNNDTNNSTTDMMNNNDQIDRMLDEGAPGENNNNNNNTAATVETSEHSSITSKEIEQMKKSLSKHSHSSASRSMNSRPRVTVGADDDDDETDDQYNSESSSPAVPPGALKGTLQPNNSIIGNNNKNNDPNTTNSKPASSPLIKPRQGPTATGNDGTNNTKNSSTQQQSNLKSSTQREQQPQKSAHFARTADDVSSEVNSQRSRTTSRNSRTSGTGPVIQSSAAQIAQIAQLASAASPLSLNAIRKYGTGRACLAHVTDMCEKLLIEAVPEEHLLKSHHHPDSQTNSAGVGNHRNNNKDGGRLKSPLNSLKSKKRTQLETDLGIGGLETRDAHDDHDDDIHGGGGVLGRNGAARDGQMTDTEDQGDGETKRTGATALAELLTTCADDALEKGDQRAVAAEVRRRAPELLLYLRKTASTTYADEDFIQTVFNLIRDKIATVSDKPLHKTVSSWYLHNLQKDVNSSMKTLCEQHKFAPMTGPLAVMELRIELLPRLLQDAPTTTSRAVERLSQTVSKLAQKYECAEAQSQLDSIRLVSVYVNNLISLAVNLLVILSEEQPPLALQSAVKANYSRFRGSGPSFSTHNLRPRIGIHWAKRGEVSLEAVSRSSLFVYRGECISSVTDICVRTAGGQILISSAANSRLSAEIRNKSDLPCATTVSKMPTQTRSRQDRKYSSSVKTLHMRTLDDKLAEALPDALRDRVFAAHGTVSGGSSENDDDMDMASDMTA